MFFYLVWIVTGTALLYGRALRFPQFRESPRVKDQITIKTPNTKCLLYWCLIEFIDWRYSQSHDWYFRPLMWTSAPLAFSMVHLPPPPFSVWISRSIFKKSRHLGLESISYLVHAQGAGPRFKPETLSYATPKKPSPFLTFCRIWVLTSTLYSPPPFLHPDNRHAARMPTTLFSGLALARESGGLSFQTKSGFLS